MILIVFTSNGAVIGERIASEIKDGLSLKNPRQLIISTDKTTKETHFAIGEIPWQPKVFNSGFGNESFDVNFPDLLNAYKQSISGLVLPNGSNIMPFSKNN